MSLNNTIINLDATIKEAMGLMYKNRFGTVLITDKENKLKGILTSGDVRKNILEGADILDKVSIIMRKDPLTIKESSLNNKEIINSLLQEAKNRHAEYIPVLNEDMTIKEMMSVSSLLGDVSHKNTNIKKVLVVGGAGYIGSVLTRKLLEKGYEVKILDMLKFGEDSIKELYSNPRFELIKGDIKDLKTVGDAIEDVDAVVHLAAIVGDPACNNETKETILTNYLSTKALAEACKYNQINRFVFASSCSTYGYGEDVLTEKSELNPVSLYARSKIKSEEDLLELTDENFSPCILRMGTIYGLSPRMRFDLVVNVLTMHATTKNKIKIFGGEQWRPLVHVADAADAYIKVLEAPIEKVKGEIFNVGSNEQNYKIKEIGNFVKEVFPTVEMEVIAQDTDERDYKVSFDKINLFLNFEAKKTIKDGIQEIKSFIETENIDPSNRVYYNS